MEGGAGQKEGWQTVCIDIANNAATAELSASI